MLTSHPCYLSNLTHYYATMLMFHANRRNRQPCLLCNHSQHSRPKPFTQTFCLQFYLVDRTWKLVDIVMLKLEFLVGNA